MPSAAHPLWSCNAQGRWLCLPQGSCLSSLLCSIFLADLESSHLQDLLPQASWHPSAHMHPQPHHHPTQPHSHHPPASSSAAHLTDLAQAADGSEPSSAEVQLLLRSTQHGVNLDGIVASQHTTGPSPSQQELSTKCTKTEHHFDEDDHMAADEEDLWFTQPSQTDAGQLNSISGTQASSDPTPSGRHKATGEGCEQEDVWCTQAGSQAVSVQQPVAKPSPDHTLSCCNTDPIDQQLCGQQLSKKQRLCQQRQASAAIEEGRLPDYQALQLPASSTGKGTVACQPPESQAVTDIQASQRGKKEHETAGVVEKGQDRRASRLQSLLMRLIDDFLFITPSRTAAEALVNKLLKGHWLTVTRTVTQNSLAYSYQPQFCNDAHSATMVNNLHSYSSACWFRLCSLQLSGLSPECHRAMQRADSIASCFHAFTLRSCCNC